MEKMYPLKLKSVYTRTIWGNDVLAEIRHDPESHGSSWDVSAHPNADNTILNGKFKGKKLSELLDEYPIEMLGTLRRDQMLRLSILDTKESLSVQVHPNNEYARTHENDEGKTEAWYIIKAIPGAKLVAGTTAKNVEEIRNAVENDSVTDIIQYHDMNEGDLICIEAGQLHAMGAGMIALEISQNSDVTYRFYDFHRKDENGNERELHLEKSLDVVDCSKQCKKQAYPLKDRFENKMHNVLDREEFSIDIIDLNGMYTFEKKQDRFYCITNVESDVELEYEDETMILKYTESMFIPASCNNIVLKGKGRIIISYVK